MSEKLVRHRVPQWFAAEGEKCETRVADRSEMLKLLRAKLVEETEELCEAIDSGIKAHVLVEAVDLFEVVDTIRELLGAKLFDAIKVTKAEERGRFHQGVVLKLGTPVPMVLICPKCSGQHIDRGVWSSTRIHRTHLCEHCGETWKPFPYATVGVEHV
jgi:predicted house-cleaning noncanonical NTP pyrophosphatase (MazG superfamily)